VELTEVLARRKMTRNFSGRPVDPGVLDRLLTQALTAPSAGNTQGRELVVLEGAEETSLFWDATTDPEWRSRSRRADGLARAPVVVLPFADPEAYAARYSEPDKRPRSGEPEVEWVVPYWLVDTAYSVMVLLLGAADAGLGAAFLGNFRGESNLHGSLGVPDRFQWFGAVLLGEAAEPDPSSSSAARPRRTVEECVHRGHW
jgi:nitroreductase